MDIESIRRLYQAALANQDLREQLRWLEQLIPVVIETGSPLAAARLVDEAFLLARRCPGLSVMERTRIGARCVRLWWRAGRCARSGKDASRYWFFRT